MHSNQHHPAQPRLWSEVTQTALQIQWQILSAAIMAMLESTTKVVSCVPIRRHAAGTHTPQPCLTCAHRLAGIKDIDDVPNQWGYSLNDYRAVFGEKYVHGCVPWEDEHISKQDRKKFDKLHSRRVQLLQELHGIEKGIRELML